MVTRIQRTGLGTKEPDIGKEDRYGSQAVGRRSIVEDEGSAADWDPDALPARAPPPAATPPPRARSERKSDLGRG
jgi:hypothetical protein